MKSPGLRVYAFIATSDDRQLFYTVLETANQRVYQSPIFDVHETLENIGKVYIYCGRAL